MSTTTLPFDDQAFHALLDAAHRHAKARWAPGTDIATLGDARMALERARQGLTDHPSADHPTADHRVAA